MKNMKKTTVFLVIFVALALVGPALAQPGGGGMGMGGGKGGGMGGRLYDPQTVTTVKGTVEKLEESHMGQAFRELLLKTDQGSILVYLGPGWYLDEQKFAVKAGDTVEATGSKLTLNNQLSLIAREVKVNGATLKLRDDQGLPLWRGKGPGAGKCPAVGPGAGQGQGPAPK